MFEREPDTDITIKNGNTELQQFYCTSKTYLKRLERHNKNTFESFIKICKQKIPSGSLVLDCGCGIGTSSYLLTEEKFRVTGIDISTLFISEARKRYGNHTNLNYLVENVEKMTFPNNSFDAVCTYDLIEHVTDVKKVLEEMNRVLKIGGVLIIFFPNHINPIKYLITGAKWKRKKIYKPCEAQTRIESFYFFIRNAYLSIVKALGVNKKIYYLKPVLSNNENACGEDFDLTWLTNWFDVENILKSFNCYSIENIIDTHPVGGKVEKWMEIFKLPKNIKLFYVKMRRPVKIVGEKHETTG